MKFRLRLIRHVTSSSHCLPIVSHLSGSGLWLGQGYGTWDRGLGVGFVGLGIDIN